ncbi:MAG TPA: DUF3999 family protein [Lacipirellulaceae bacterium]|nr:DUF3999 family protein [Lacipirellulaceae bacterium]
MMGSRGVAIGALICACIFRITPLSAAELAQRFVKMIEMPAIHADALVVAPLDGDVYAAAADDYADLRLLDEAGQETAYVLRHAARRHTRQERRTTRIVNPTVRPRDDGGLEIAFEVDRQRHPWPVAGVVLYSPLRDFERQVDVYGSADGDSWRIVLEGGLVFDYSRHMDVRNRELPLAESDPAARRFRLIVNDVTQDEPTPLKELTRRTRNGEEAEHSERLLVNRQSYRIDAIDVWSEVAGSPALEVIERNYAVEEVRVEHDAQSRESHVYFDGRRAPLTRLRLVTPEKNFSRPMRLEVPLTAKAGQASGAWGRILGVGTVARLEFRDLRREQLEIAFPEARASSYRAVIENQDSPPLEITGVEASGISHELVFLARPGRSYRLSYGTSRMAPPRYDIAAIQTLLAEGFEPSSAALGPQEMTGVNDTGNGVGLIAALNDVRIQTAIVAVLVVALAVVLYRAVRRMDALPPDAR